MDSVDVALEFVWLLDNDLCAALEGARVLRAPPCPSLFLAVFPPFLVARNLCRLHRFRGGFVDIDPVSCWLCQIKLPAVGNLLPHLGQPNAAAHGPPLSHLSIGVSENTTGAAPG